MWKAMRHTRIDSLQKQNKSKKKLNNNKNKNMNDHQDELHAFFVRLWKNFPRFFGTFLMSTIIFVAGISMNGEWLIFLVYFLKQFGDEHYVSKFTTNKFQNIHLYLFYSYLMSYIIYFSVCGFLQWYFYICLRHTPEIWKCQPKQFLTWKDEKFEIILGTINLSIGATISAVMSCYIMNGGNTTIYYKISDYGLIYFLLSIPILFIWVDIQTYFLHRMLHLPFFYKNFHKIHHRFKQPTSFSATAMHPAEFIMMQSAMLLPLILVPFHWAVYLVVVGYVFYYGIIDHSGIKMDSIWPWQPSSMFHDDHHKYFHVNFGFNLTLWDKLQGTYRLKDRIYNETIFYGRGKSMTEASQQELDEHFKED